MKEADKNKNDIVLELRNITKIFSGTIALRNVNVQVSKGKVQGIIGKNGAGKTTLVGIMSGIITPTEGEIILHDHSFRSLSRSRARKNGVSIVTQEAEVIPDWTVAENLFVPDFICSWDRQTIKWRDMFTMAEELLNKHNLLIGVHEKVKDLTISEQQLLLILKACYVENSEVIIFDEVSTALSKKEEQNLYEIIEEQKSLGKAILYISHRMDEILEICDSVTVIRDGAAVATESCKNMDSKRLSSFIVGSAKDDELKYNGSSEQKEEEILTVENLTRIGFFKNISFTLKKTEIVGLCGLRGSGRTELFQAIAGILPADEGWILLEDGKRVRFKKPGEAISKGIVYLTEDRDKDGLVNILSVRDNLTLSSLEKVSKANFIAKKKEEQTVDHLIDLLSIHTPTSKEYVKNLSGGNRQKVLLGKVFAIKPNIYLLDEPTKGIDIAAKKDILTFIRTELVKDSGVLITLPDIPSLMTVCDRIFIMYNGEFIQEIKREQFNETKIYNASQGLVNKNIEPTAALQ